MSSQPFPEAIIFLNPPYKYIIQRKLRCSPRRSGYVFPPLELLSLASVFHLKDRARIVFIDAIAQRLTSEAVIEVLKGYDVRMIIFMPGFESFEGDLKTVSSIKERLPSDACLVCFGFLPSLYYEDILQQFSLINYIIVGEPEASFMELIEAVLLKGIKMEAIKGLAFIDGGGVVFTGERREAIDLEALPFPDRGLIRNDLYGDPFLGKPMTSVNTSRGCAHRCGFCVAPYGRGFRQRSANNVLAELGQIVDQFNIRHVRFMDDNFTVNKKRLMSICQGMIDSHLGLRWTCLSRVDTFDEEMLRIMAKAGCKAIFVGIESGSQRMLDYYGKGYTVDMVRRQCRMIKKTGIDMIAWFMIGAPLEAAADIRESIDLAVEVDADFICINEFRPMPTTRIFGELRDRVSVSVFPFEVRHISGCLGVKELEGLRREFYLKFYLSSGVVGRMLWRYIRQPVKLVFFIKEFISATRKEYVEK